MPASAFTKPHTDFAKLGIKAQVELDLPAMMAQKDKVVGELTKGVEFLLRKNKAEAIVGEARITAPGQGRGEGQGRRRAQPAAKHIIIATGSDVTPLPGVDHRRGADRVLHRRAVAEASAQRDCWWWARA